MGENLPLDTVANVPLPGGATRRNFIVVDSVDHRVYLAHMGDGSVISVDTNRRAVLAEGQGTPLVRGVLAVPQLGRVYAAAAGSGEVVVMETNTLKVLDRIPAGNVDGLDYVPSVRRLFVTDQRGGNDVAIDANTDEVLEKIPVGADVGNTRFDAGSGRVLVAVGSTNKLVAIDPESLAGRGALSPARSPRRARHRHRSLDEHGLHRGRGQCCGVQFQFDQEQAYGRRPGGGRRGRPRRRPRARTGSLWLPNREWSRYST